MKNFVLIILVVALGFSAFVIFHQREAQHLMLTKIETLRLEALASAINSYARHSSRKELPVNLQVLLKDDGQYRAIDDELLENPWGCAVLKRAGLLEPGGG